MKKAFFACLLFTQMLQAQDFFGDEGRGTFFAGGDWLYWKAAEQKLQFATQVSVASTEETLNVNGEVLKPDFKMDNGFRVFTGYKTQDQAWEVTLSYTHFKADAHISRSVNGDTDFIVFLPENFPLLSGAQNALFLNASQSFNANINYIDLDISRSFVFCEDLEINPHVGLRGQWIHQQCRIRGEDPIIFASRMKTELNGIGLEGGLWATWNLPYGVSLVGHFGGALTYNKVHNKGVLTLAAGSSTEHNNPGYVSNAWVDSFVGFSYSRNFCDFLVNVHAGWEHHLIFNTNQYSISGGGDMTLQGLTLGAAIEF